MIRRRFGCLGALVLGVLVAVATCDDALAVPGQVLGEQKISDTAGSFTGTLDDNDNFGSAVTTIADLDGNGVDDLVVGAHEDDDGGSNRGAAWVLFMQASGSVASHAKMSSTSGGLSGPLDNGDQMGCAVADLGDLDGDTVADLAVGSVGDDDGGTDRGAVYVLFMNANGTVKAEQKISSTTGGLTGPLDNDDNFGRSIVALGDLDGDNVTDIAVGAPKDDDGGGNRGAVYILFLNSNGTVKAETKLSEASPGLIGGLENDDGFGFSVASLGDIDGDDITDVAVGAPFDDDGGGGPFSDRGAVWVLFLDTDGSVKGTQKISDTTGDFNGVLDDLDMFGASVGRTPDLDNNGVTDLAVGATGDDQGGPDRGQVWILFMETDGTVKAVGGFRRINVGSSGFVGPLDDLDFFGTSVVAFRDLDGDQVSDLAVGARRDDDGGSNRGAVWVLFMDGVPGALCGDTVLDPGEDCDDGNKVGGDCCDASCEFESNGSPCLDADVCNGEETCDGAGTCTPGTPLTCDDGQACTQDICDPVDGCESVTGPAPVCFFAGKSVVTLKDKSPNRKDKLNWKWVKGDEVLFSDLGDPESSDSYTLCIYDTIGENPTLQAELIVPAGANWRTIGTSKGWKYKDGDAVEAGVKSIKLLAREAGKSKALFKAKGDNLAPELPGPVGATYFDQDTRVVIQLINSLGFCWTSDFDAPARKNETEQFKDKIP